MSILCLHECKRDREGFGNFMHERVRERREEGRKGWGKGEGGKEGESGRYRRDESNKSQ